MISGLRRFSVLVLAAALAVPSMGIHTAEAARHKHRIIHQQPDRFAEIVIDANSGYVYSEKNPDKRLYPASLTKMMTLYLTFDALEAGRMSRNQRIEISKHAAAQEPSSLGLSPGETIRIEDAILAIATKSANDCAVALAEAVGGSEPRFAQMMTAKAHELGMRNTNFVNASGLFKPMQFSSARDMSILARALIHDHPRYYRYFSTASFTYNGETFLNHNHLMSRYRGMDGLKTGYVYASGYNLAASAVRNGTRLIGVVFGGRTANSRNNAMAQLLDQAFLAAKSGAGSRVASAEELNAVQPAAQRPVALAAATTASAADSSETAQPQFSSLGLVVEQGDTSESSDIKRAVSAEKAPMPALQLQPQPINTRPLAQQPAASAQTASAGATTAGDWAIQIGAFSSHDAGEKALQYAKTSLNGMINGVDSIAPLMTPRGMVYRARLSGLGRDGAMEACRILKGNCLILTVE